MMNTRRVFAAVITLVAVPWLARPVMAQTVYTTESAFDAANPGSNQVNFSFSGIQALGSTYSTDGATFLSTGTYGLVGVGPNAVGNGNYSFLANDTSNNGLLTSFTSSSAVSLTLAGNYAGYEGDVVSITAFDGLNQVYTGNYTIGGLDDFTFFGLSGVGPVTSIDITTASSPEFISILSAEYAPQSEIPEPAAVSVLAFGLLGLGWLRYRHVKQAATA